MTWQRHPDAPTTYPDDSRRQPLRLLETQRPCSSLALAENGVIMLLLMVVLVDATTWWRLWCGGGGCGSLGGSVIVA